MTSENAEKYQFKPLLATSPFPPILIAEDDDDDCHLLQRAFEKAQIVNPLLIARNGEEVLALLTGMGAHLKTGPRLPSMLILDLRMPRMGGFEVLTWLRRHRPLKRLPVIVLTESNNRADINKAYDLGVNSVIRKRHDLDELTEVIRDLHTYWLCWNEMPDLMPNGESL